MGIFTRRSSGFSYYRREHRFRKRLFSLILFFFILYLVFQFISLVVVSPFRMQSTSMEPAIPEGSRCLSVPLIYGIWIPMTDTQTPGFGQPRRGDIVICIPPTHQPARWYASLADSVIRFFTLGRVRLGGTLEQTWERDTTMKRIIGIPGDTLKMEGFEVLIKPAGKQSFFSEFEIIQQSYTIMVDPLPEGWKGELPFSGNTEEITLEKGEYFLLGDHRTASKDSAVWGPVQGRLIRSRVVLSYLPGFALHCVTFLQTSCRLNVCRPTYIFRSAEGSALIAPFTLIRVFRAMK